jgi:hypothetical protein
MDCEFATANRICGWAGIVTVIGTCAIATLGAVAVAQEDQPHKIAKAAGISA